MENEYASRPAVFQPIIPAPKEATCLTCGAKSDIIDGKEFCACGANTWVTTEQYIPFEEDE